ISYARAHVTGDIGGRMIDETILKEVGGVLSERLELQPASDWTNVPISHLPPLEAELGLTGTVAMRWSEIGMQVEKDISGAPLPFLPAGGPAVLSVAGRFGGSGG